MIPRVARDEPLPLSPAQERLWFLDRLTPGTAVDNLRWCARLRGPLDVPALRAALADVVARHEVLRTAFPAAGDQPVPAVGGEVAVRWTMERCDQDAALRGAEREAHTPFDLERGPLIRARLSRLTPTDHLFTLVVHHIVCDGWSLEVLAGELAHRYAARQEGAGTMPLPEPAIQYGDFAAWQRQWLGSPEIAEQTAYWRERLAGASPALALRTDRPRPVRQSLTCDRRPVTLPGEVTTGLRALCTRYHVTLSMALLAGFKIMLAAHSGQTDILVGTPVPGRPRAELEQVVGPFVNTLVLRTDLSGDPTFAGLLRRVRTSALGSYGNQDLPFPLLVDELWRLRDPRHSPIVQVMYAFGSTVGGPVGLPGLVTEPVDIHPRASRFDLSLALEDDGDTIAGGLVYNTALFDAGTLHGMLRDYAGLLAAAVRTPEAPLSVLAGGMSA